MGVILSFFYKTAAMMLAALYLAGLPVNVRENPLNGYMTVTAHAGCTGYPDNSIEDISACIDTGADTVEIDLRFDKNGTPVLSHDALEENSCYVTLEEAFDFLLDKQDVSINIDVKSFSYLEKVPVLAEEKGVADRISFIGIREEDVETLRIKCPDVPFYLRVDVPENAGEYEALADAAVETGASGINVSWKYITMDFISVFHNKNIPVSVWMVDDAESACRMILYGVDDIISNSPGMIKDVYSGSGNAFMFADIQQNINLIFKQKRSAA